MVFPLPVIAVIFDEIDDMRKLILLVLFVFTGVSGFSQSANKLGVDFIKSLAAGNFALLDKYMPREADMKKHAGAEWAKIPAKERPAMLAKMKKRINEDWKQIWQRTRAAGLEWGKLQVQETVVYSPVGQKESKQRFMVIAYQYNDLVWDDISLVVMADGAELLVAIPTPTRALTMNPDSRGRELNTARALQLAGDPATQKNLENAARELLIAARKASYMELCNMVVYRGTKDQARRWKDAADCQNEEEQAGISELTGQYLQLAGNDNTFSYQKFTFDSESEGIWFVLRVKGAESGKAFTLAFLRIKDRWLLGDVDSN